LKFLSGDTTGCRGKTLPFSPEEVPSVQEHTFTVPTLDGQKLFVYQWSPDSDSPAGILHIVHGMSETAARYARFAARAAERGYIVYAHDQRGHGKTAASPELLGDIGPDGFRRMAEDMKALNDLIRARHQALPVYVMGHSMGSFLVRLYLGKYGDTVAGAIISGTGSPPRMAVRLGMQLARREMRSKGSNGRSEVLTRLVFGRYNQSFKPSRTDFDWLSRDASEVDQYVQNPYCGKPFTNESYYHFYRGLLEALSARTLSSTPKDLPMFVFSGEKDPVGGHGKGVQKYVRQLRNAGFTDVAVKLYPEGRHEMLNELNRDEVTTDILNWLSARR
jgi:alpha-beta hydrolase superfamily lysophospholipase